MRNVCTVALVALCLGGCTNLPGGSISQLLAGADGNSTHSNVTLQTDPSTATATASQPVSPVEATSSDPVATSSATSSDNPTNTYPKIPTTSSTLQVPARSNTSSYWQNGIQLAASQSVNIVAGGHVGYALHSDYNSYTYVDANGLQSDVYLGGLNSNLPALALVGMFQGAHSTTFFLIGTSKTFHAPEAGRFFVGINTWVTSGTQPYDLFTGSFAVTVSDAGQ